MQSFMNEVLMPHPFMNSMGLEAAISSSRMIGMTGGNPASAAWPTANLAVYVPFSIETPYPMRRMFWVNGATLTGNWDFGIFDEQRYKLWATGNAAASGANAPQYFTKDALIPPGDYFYGLVGSSTTVTIFSVTLTAIQGRALGCYQEALGSANLPDRATFAAYNTTRYPLVGITTTETGF